MVLEPSIVRATIFTGNNYQNWSQDMAIRLKGLNLYNSVTDPNFHLKLEDESDADFNKLVANFEGRDQTAQSLLLQTIAKPYHQSGWANEGTPDETMVEMFRVMPGRMRIQGNSTTWKLLLLHAPTKGLDG